jgi:hypothetical protein
MAHSGSSGQLLAHIEASADILTLATNLLRMCRAHLLELVNADGDTTTWRVRDRLRRKCERLFEEVGDVDIDADERARLAELAAEVLGSLPAVIVAHVIGEALDSALGDRFLPMFLNRRVALEPGDPVPTPHPDWRQLTTSPNSDPWVLDGRLDALPHLRLAGDWADHVRVTVDGGWRTWHSVPQLRRGDALACAVPNESFGEFTLDRGTVEGRPVFFNMRVNIGDERQAERCIELLETAADNGCRIVVFPELSAPQPVRDAIKAWLNKQDTVELVVAGSRHRPARDDRWYNECSVLIRGHSRRLVHRKFRAFSFMDPDESGKRVRRTEHLASTAARFQVWLSPHWTFAVLVCKDAVQQPVPTVLGELRANLVLVPTLSFKMDAFRTVAADVATWSQGVTMMANAAIAARPRSSRPPIVIGMPSQRGSVVATAPPPRSLLVVRVGSRAVKVLRPPTDVQ